MQIDTATKTAGRQSLQLGATHHDACVHTTANVHQATDYLLSFDYQTAAGTKAYGYTTSFDDPGATFSRNQLTTSGPGWHTMHTVVHVPDGARTLTLYLYAFESGRSTSIVHYDNVGLTELPNFADRFFVVQQPAKKLVSPKQATFAMPAQSIRSLRVTGATTPFFVQVSESYHPRWRLELHNAGVSGLMNSWLPQAPATTVGTRHTIVSDAINGWLVDPAKLCRSSAHTVRSGCTRNTDGSYNLDLEAEFVPQRWFTIAAVISWLTLLGSAAYLVIVRPKDAPTYRRRT